MRKEAAMKQRKIFKVAYPDLENRLGRAVEEWQKSQPSNTKFLDPVALAIGTEPLGTTIVTIDFQR